MVQINVKKIVQAENSQKRKRRNKKIKNRMEANCWKSLHKWIPDNITGLPKSM
jgi:hypothetical protein